MDPQAPAVSFEDYVAMSGAAAVLGYEGMLAHYRITPAHWGQIAGQWNARIPTSPEYVQYGTLVQNEAARIRAGGAPKPVTFAPAQQQPYPQPHAGASPFGTPQQQQNFDRQLDRGFNELGSALNSFGNALGGAIDGSLGIHTPGRRVFVQWSDGNRYPGTVVGSSGGQVQVAFPDGRQIWVPAHAVILG